MWALKCLGKPVRLFLEALRGFYKAHGHGWLVGRAAKNERTIAFVTLEHDDQAHSVPAGVSVRESFLSRLPGLVQ